MLKCRPSGETRKVKGGDHENSSLVEVEHTLLNNCSGARQSFEAERERLGKSNSGHRGEFSGPKGWGDFSAKGEN